MRITGGKLCGRHVNCPPGVIRPAMDRMRESMFSILGDITDCSFLDLFAGSGVMALEAISRGADKAVLVEKDAGKKRTLLANLHIAGDKRTKMILRIRPVEHFFQAKMELFDIVYLDPPFPMKNKHRLIELAEAAGQPAPGGILIIHHPAEDPLPENIGRLQRTDLRRYGRSFLAFYIRKNIETYDGFS